MQRTVLVTGADRGLGFALCTGLLDRGWRVFAGQYMPDWPELDALATQYHDHLALVPLDVSCDESVRAAARAVGEAAGRVGLLINNAGVSSPTMMRSIRDPQRQTRCDENRLVMRDWRGREWPW